MVQDKECMHVHGFSKKTSQKYGTYTRTCMVVSQTPMSFSKEQNKKQIGKWNSDPNKSARR